MATVRLKNLHKRFSDGTVAVHDLSLEIAEREFITFLGPSGCGKTTTLRMIAGLENATSGEILFGDRPIDDLPPATRNVAMVFQSYALYPHMSVAQNLEYPLRKRGVERGERARRVQETATLLQIEALLARRPRALSGGQQQRVALGRAIIRDPEVFLLDEPLSNLDATLRAHMRVELIQLHRRIAKTMIYVTHDQIEAMTMSTRIAVMHQGRLQQVGAPAEIYGKPANRFVASFVGTPAMNFISGRLAKTGDGLSFEGSGLSVSLPAEVSAKLPGDVVTLNIIAGIRPEDVVVGIGEHEAEVIVVEPTGHESLVFLNRAGMNLVARLSAEHSPPSLGRIAFGLKPAKLHLFNAESGVRLLN